MDDATVVAERVLGAKHPIDAFGSLLEAGSTSDQLEELRRIYFRITKTIHPDRNGGAKLFNDATAHANVLLSAAMEALTKGTYHERWSAEIHAGGSKYLIGDYKGRHGFADAYAGIKQGGEAITFTVAHEPRDNDIIRNEGDVLELLYNDRRASGYFRHLPDLLQSFDYKEGSKIRRANIFAYQDGWVSLEEAMQALPGGIDPRDLTWMFRRLLDVIGYTHHRGYLHGAIHPGNIMIGLGDIHEVKLVNWQAATAIDTKISIMDKTYSDYYAPEVKAKEPADTRTDIFMLGMTFWAALTTATGSAPVRGFYQSMVFTNPGSRPGDCWQLLDEYTRLIEKAYGKRKYRPFYLPTK